MSNTFKCAVDYGESCWSSSAIESKLLLLELKISVTPVEMWWHTVTHWRGSEGETGELEWVASTLHTTSEHGVSSTTTADAHTSAARIDWTDAPPPLPI